MFDQQKEIWGRASKRETDKESRTTAMWVVGFLAYLIFQGKMGFQPALAIALGVALVGVPAVTYISKLAREYWVEYELRVLYIVLPVLVFAGITVYIDFLRDEIAQLTGEKVSAEAQLDVAQLALKGVAVGVADSRATDLAAIELLMEDRNGLIATNVALQAKVAVAQATAQAPLPSAIEFMDRYYRGINDANQEEDLETQWNMLDQDFQLVSNPEGIRQFTDFWWPFRAGYKLYECDINEIDVELMYYDRDNLIFSDLKSTEIIHYTLDFRQTDWIIESGERIPEISFCELVLIYPEDSDE